MLNDFKKFILRGNVIDLAVGVIIGGAFGKIVSSLVNDIITPAIGIFLVKGSLADLKIVINEEASINYGLFLQNIIDFLIIAFVIFIFIKAYTKLLDSFKKKEEVKEEPKPEVIPAEQLLLQEIRDILKNKN